MNPLRGSRPLACHLLAFVLCVASALAFASDFTIYTQNLLRFGHGGEEKTQAKCDALNTVSVKVDIILIQELMQADYPCGDPPDGYIWESYGPFVRGTYKEFYGFLWRNEPRSGGPDIKNGGYYFSAEADKFAQPPHAIFLRVKPNDSSKTHHIWVGTIHTVFSGGQVARRTEATATARFFEDLRGMRGVGVTPPAGGFPVIIGGDWNLSVRTKAGELDDGFNALVDAGADVQPNVLTSLNEDAELSSAYDHFAFDKAKLKLTKITLNPKDTSDYKAWRETVSDHLGVSSDVAFQ